MTKEKPLLPSRRRLHLWVSRKRRQKKPKRLVRRPKALQVLMKLPQKKLPNPPLRMPISSRRRLRASSKPLQPKTKRQRPTCTRLQSKRPFSLLWNRRRRVKLSLLRGLTTIRRKQPRRQSSRTTLWPNRSLLLSKHRTKPGKNKRKHNKLLLPALHKLTTLPNQIHFQI